MANAGRVINLALTGRSLAVTGSDFYTCTGTTALTGTNNDIDFATKIGGYDDVTIAYVDPGGVTAALSISVTAHAITVNLARAASAITTTAAQIIAALAANAAANALVSAANKAGNDGTGIVTAMAATPINTKVGDQNIDVRVDGPDEAWIVQEQVDADGTGAWTLGDETIEVDEIGIVHATAAIGGTRVATAQLQVFSG